MILFTSSTYVKSVTPIDNNLQDKQILPAIRQAQLMEIKPTIGEALYNRLAALISSGDISKEENIAYKDLLDKLQDFLSFATVCRIIPIVAFKIGNMGLSRTKDENLDYAGIDEVNQIVDYYGNMRDEAKLELQNFLLNNSKAYKELDECACRAIEANLYSANSCGVFLGGARGKIRRNYKKL